MKNFKEYFINEEEGIPSTNVVTTNPTNVTGLPIAGTTINNQAGLKSVMNPISILKRKKYNNINLINKEI